MRGCRSMLLGFSMAVLFSAILAGSLLLSLSESGFEIAQHPASSFTMTSSPVTTQFLIPGRPTRTVTATSSFTDTPTSTFVPPSACPPPPGWVAIVILPDDTLPGLARIYQVDEESLAYGNCMEPGVTTLQPGVVFYVPGPPPLPPSPLPSPTNPTYYCGAPPGWVVYIVRYGDTLLNLSQRLNVSIYQLQLANCMGSSTYINVGQSIFVPYLPPVMPPQVPPPPPPPSTPPFHITPIYTYVSPPTSINTYTLTATIQPSPSATPTTTSTATLTPSPSPTPTYTPTLTSTNTILAPFPPPGMQTPTDTPSAYLFYGFPQ